MNKKMIDGTVYSGKRLLIVLFFLSLAVRFAVLLPIVINKGPLKYDEKSYYLRAGAYHSVFKDLIHFKTPEEADMEEAYRRGIWPPLHSIVLGLGFLIFGKSIAAARLVVVLISALTTPLVFLLSTRLSNRKSGIAASLIHIFYPSFIAFSHFLWSETTFIFLFFLALYAVIRLPEVESLSKKIPYGILLGIALGLMVLTRAAALFFLIMIPAYLFIILKNRRDKIIIPLITVITLIIVIFPWQYTLIQKADRFVLLSNYTYRNLYHGNNPWVRNSFGSDSIDHEFLPHRTLRKYVRDKSIPIEQAAKELATAEISGHFGAFILRSFRKFLVLWPPDFFPLRHMFNGVYPPLPDILALLIFFLIVVSCIFLYLCVIKGFFAKEIPLKHLLFLLSLVVVGMAPYILAYSHTRYNLPQLALLLPLAGVGLANFKNKFRWYPIAAAITIVCFLAVSFYTYHHFLYKKCYPSSYYRGSVALLDKLFNTETLFHDIIKIKTNDPVFSGRVKVSIADNGNYSFAAEKNIKERTIDMVDSGFFMIFSRRPAAPLVLSVYLEKQDKVIRVKPISRFYWNKFQPLPENLSICWFGGI